MRKFFGIAATAACMIASPAFAQALPASDGVSATFAGGVLGVQPGETLIADYDTTNGGVTCANPAACVIQNVSNGQGADTTNSGNYLAVIGNQMATFSFSTPLSELGLDLGSADNYNTFTLTLMDGTSATFSGSDIPGSDSTVSRPTGRLTFLATGSNPITDLVLGSTQNSLETDNLAGVAVPEPATWAMMLIGFGGVGFVMRRRKAAAKVRQLA
jgi:hypothetical protein